MRKQWSGGPTPCTWCMRCRRQWSGQPWRLRTCCTPSQPSATTLTDGAPTTQPSHRPTDSLLQISCPQTLPRSAFQSTGSKVRRAAPRHWFRPRRSPAPSMRMGDVAVPAVKGTHTSVTKSHSSHATDLISLPNPFFLSVPRARGGGAVPASLPPPTAPSAALAGRRRWDSMPSAATRHRTPSTMGSCNCLQACSGRF